MNRSHSPFIVFALSLLGGCSAPPDGGTRVVSSASALAGADCTSDSDCDATEYCATPEGTCGGTGTCTGRGIGAFCMTLWQPVCGCDGVTYANACYAQKAGASLLSDGACADGSADDAGTGIEAGAAAD
ncbi:MAG TPA: Kazal-type serine protease inhibitor domain-containing protein [Polyangiaceae bacterium]|nr:Kazal-type serine protease inhibitor domain-containing protein [Polyangiaceae bacterium]